MRLYTKLLRFFLRDLYARTETARSESADNAKTLQETKNQVILFQENSALQIAILQEQNKKFQEKIKNLQLEIKNSDTGHHERTERCEKRLDCLEHYRSETEKRMQSDDMTTLELSHRLELTEQTLQENNLYANALELFNKKTYSQAGEDAIILYACAMLGIPFQECNYLDLGANKPVEMSNTYFFYQQGARGVLLEANPALIPALQNKRSEDIILNQAVTDKSDENIIFNILNLDGLSKIGDISEILEKNPTAKLMQAITIKTITVNDIIKNYFDNKAPVILNLDIEGLELEILKSIDFEIYRPLFLIIEMIPYSKNLSVGIKNQELLNFMQSKNYLEYAFTGINSIFIDKIKYQELISRKEQSHAE
ncbi:MAG: FkbM family methyltransferase [Oscillospiraceae bacterium]|nr:FkbM family methyltransferase [Oscillospiraceae bacterium]